MDITVQRGAIPVTLDRERLLFFDHRATWLLIRKYGSSFISELYLLHGSGKDAKVELKSMDALAYFLYVGLLADASAKGETLTQEDVESFLKPFTFARIFNAVVVAVTQGISTPVQEGKAEAAGVAAKPAAVANAAQGPGPTLASTSTKRSGSRSQR